MPVPPPSAGLGSNSNYFLTCNGANILNLKVTIDVTTDMISNIGFGFQLNAYSTATAQVGSWQQYMFVFNTISGLAGAAGTLYGWIEPWPRSTAGLGTDTTSGDLINRQYSMLTIQNGKLLAGYKLTVELGNDSGGNVRYLTFTAADNNGNPVTTSPATIDLLTLPLDGSGKLATQQDLAPIVTFQLNLVGPGNAEQSYLETGAGTITYSAAQDLYVVNALPSDTDTAWFTEETTNSAYSQLDAGPSASFTQNFTTASSPAFSPPGSYFVQAYNTGPFAVSQQIGDNQTDLFLISRDGELVVFYVGGAGHWSQSVGYGPTGMARQGTATAACRQFGTNQTDVFLFGQNGQLNVFWVEGNGSWNGPVPIGKGGAAPSGASLAVSQQFGASNQTDVFYFDNNGQLNVCWVQSAGPWNGPEKIGAKNAAPAGANLAASQQFGIANQTDVFYFDDNGQLNVCWVQSAGSWNGPGKIGAKIAAPAGANLAASQQFGIANQTDVFYFDNNGQLNVCWVEGVGAWKGPEKIGPAGVASAGAHLAVSQQLGAPNQTDVFIINHNGQLNVCWVDSAGAWNGPETIGPAGLAAPGSAVAASPQFGAANQTDVIILNVTGNSAPGWPMVFWVDGTGAWNGPKALVVEV